MEVFVKEATPAVHCANSSSIEAEELLGRRPAGVHGRMQGRPLVSASGRIFPRRTTSQRPEMALRPRTFLLQFNFF